jgi:hypothetical protein
MSDFQSRQFLQQLDDTMRYVKSAAANLDDSSQQIHRTIAEISCFRTELA